MWNNNCPLSRQDGSKSILAILCDSVTEIQYTAFRLKEGSSYILLMSYLFLLLPVSYQHYVSELAEFSWPIVIRCWDLG